MYIKLDKIVHSHTSDIGLVTSEGNLHTPVELEKKDIIYVWYALQHNYHWKIKRQHCSYHARKKTKGDIGSIKQDNHIMNIETKY